MASLSAHFLFVIVVLGLCSATVRQSQETSCPAPCRCQNFTIVCTECPKSYISVSKSVKHIYVTDCQDIQYFLRMHRREGENSYDVNYQLSKLEIRNSFIRQPETYIYNDYNTQSLILSNDSITKISADVKSANLTYLDLSNNKLNYIDNRTFINMKLLVYLDLSGNCIFDTGSECFKGLDRLLYLDLSSNNLTHLSNTVFMPLVSLQKLNLSANKLETLFEKSFHSLLLLQQLDISYNRLTSVAPGTLQFLPNLAKLLMTDNPQLKPDAQVFVGTGRRLQQVDASRTGLSQVPEALTHSVRYLTLAGNRIASVRCGDLDSYPLLNMLDFSDNIILDIEDDALGRLEMLSQLHLDKNRLRTVPKMLPDKLSYLSLDNNLIQNLTIIDFVSLAGLKILIISNNNISYIQENAFIQLISLEMLDLSNNQLKVLTPNTFSGPSSLKDLRMASVNISLPAKDISFPVPSPEGIENLHLEFSPGLARQLMADTAALAAMTRLQNLDMRYCNITTIRSDLLHYLPELRVLRLEGNTLNCEDLGWLGEWMRENPSINNDKVTCSSPFNLTGKLVKELPRSINYYPVIFLNNTAKVGDAFDNKKKNWDRIEDNLINDESDVKKKESSDRLETKVSFQKKSDLKDEININKAQTDIHLKEVLKNNNSAITPTEPSTETNNRSKLLQIFSEWAREPQNRQLQKKERSQIDVSPCSGNSNSAENKTKCLHRSGTTPKAQNINMEQSGFMYRKIENGVAIFNVDNATKHEVHDVGNASEHRSSSLRAEANASAGVLAACGAAMAIVAAVAAAWAARRPRQRPQRPHDLMEVPTIAAVGELW